MQIIERNVLRDEHWVSEVGQSVLQLFGRSKQSSELSLDTFLLLQSCWIHWVPHVTAGVQGTYVVWSSKAIEWCWGTLLLRSDFQWLEVVEYTGKLVEFRHSCEGFDRFNCHGGYMELQLSLDLAVRTRQILQTIRATRRHDQYIAVMETSTRRSDQSLKYCNHPCCPSFRSSERSLQRIW